MEPQSCAWMILTCNRFFPRLKREQLRMDLKTQADYTAREISVSELQTHFTVFHQGKKLGRISSESLGNHNVCNTLAAVAVGMELNMDFPAVSDALKNFKGVQRRFEILNQSDSLTIVDDYGHHPAEIQATLETAKIVWPNRRLVVIFQPHRLVELNTCLKVFIHH